MGAAEATPLHDFEDESLWTHELQTLLEEGGVDVIAVEAKGAFASNHIRSTSCHVTSCLL